MIREFYLRLKKIPFTIIAIALFFLALEGAVRLGLHIYGLVRYRTDISSLRETNLKATAETGWEWTQGRTFRGRDVKPEKPPGLYRIITTGDSCCWGALVPADFTFSAVMEKKLRERYGESHVEVLNAGVVGYNSAQAAGLIRKTLAAYKPDLIVFYGTGEFATIYTRGMPEGVMGWRGDALPYFSRSRVFLLMNQLIRRLHPPPDSGQVLAQDKKIDVLNAAAAEAGAKLILTEYLLLVDGVLTSKLLGREIEFSVPVVRTYKAFMDTGLPVDKLMFDHVHPTAAGHKIIGELIANEIEREGLIAQQGVSGAN